MATGGTPKVVLITGGTSGLGKAAAILLAQRGYRVFASGRSEEKRAQLTALAREKSLPLEAIELDVCDDASVKAGVGDVLTRAGAIDVLFNNAGISIIATVEDLRLEDWRRQFETNVFGVLRVTQAVLPHMRTRRSGRILMMSSVSGLMSPPAQGAYSSSKHALEGLSNSLRLELYSFGIDVVLIEPGYIVTGIQDATRANSVGYAAQVETGPYAKVYAGFEVHIEEEHAQAKTTAEDCAQVILKAIEAPRPKPRYAVTPSAALVKWCKRLLSDDAFDVIIRRTFRLAR